MAEIEKSETEEAKGGKSRIWIEKKRLAYPIQKDGFGYYLNSWIWLKPEEINDLKRFLKLEKEIVRFFILTRANASVPAPLRDAVALDKAEQLEERKPERKPHYERKMVEPVRPAVVPKPKAEVKVEPTPVVLPVAKPKEKKVLPVEEIIEKEPIAPEPEEEPKKEESATKPKKKAVEKEAKPEAQQEIEKEVEKKEQEEKATKLKKITLEELDQRLDDILNEDIL